MSEATAFHTGFIAIVGRPNVGKSTLLNRLIGQKISIVSRKAQTTRHRITGIRTDANAQFIFVDTPGFQTKYRSALNDAMNRGVTTTLSDVDVVLFVIEASKFDERDVEVMKLLPKHRPVILVLNKADLLKDKGQLLPFIQRMSTQFPFHAIVPVSAKKVMKVDVLVDAIKPLLPEGEPMYEEDQVTDRSERFLASELIREKIFRLVGDELPYSTTVEIERWEEEGNLRRIFAAILVDRDAQKAIVIGHEGEKLKEISTQARTDMEKMFDCRVYLEVFVKVKSGWADDTRLVRQFGYE
ncbi:GTPase Era [Chitinimonas sp. BJB300]|uniref:GTPase Era n=1 Tax=Chitinimonas sp. BJB300 TaxID=1559339 RepID=UPI000C0C778C|nr:GTPase Era [Chitinimonas sp. BJB300]PHV11572.1 GTPase Era [Chitinimonas sp. BJB300]TSJ88970.1 GTPase Era [Chitinimonas sp. BJB300]